jgi:hypothetical protein
MAMKDTPQISDNSKKIASLIVLWLLVAGSWKSIEVIATLFKWVFH